MQNVREEKCNVLIAMDINGFHFSYFFTYNMYRHVVSSILNDVIDAYLKTEAQYSAQQLYTTVVK